LLLVADVTPTRGGDLHLLPRLDAVDPSDRGPFAVTLVLPDGATREVKAMVDVPHVRGPGRPMGMLRLLGVAASEVPVGTRVER
jgi:hypothetical protein